MKRAALDRPRSVHTWRRHSKISGLVGHTYKELHPGHFRKGRQIGGCGNAACWLRHTGKLVGDPTLQESRHLMAFREQLKEVAG